MRRKVSLFVTIISHLMMTLAYILTAVIVVDVGLAMVFLIWDMFKKLKKIGMRIVLLFNKFRMFIKEGQK